MSLKSKIILLPLLTLSLIPSVQCNNNAEPEEKKWEIIWQDEFEGPLGQSPDSVNWMYDTWGNESGWGNNQLEYDTDRPENVSLDGAGNLAIVARKESYAGKGYTSARITTQGLRESTYGRFEARIKLPWGQGLWPAFWLLGSDFNTAGWPHCGEIDIMEYRGQEPSIIHGTLHGPGYSGGQGVGTSYLLSNARFDTDFHTFAVEWDLEGISWFVDDVLYQTLDSNDVNGDWVYDHPFFIILNLAVGGGYVGSPDADTVFPQTMLIDYVRVYQEVE
ncbi:MAG: glycoside hydrolase family 16 protein [Candidatus Marinimicrobia bacterium]|jgi:beta-glucanase (GH16 family)|nr:glycoside hydrolase family 16 protein [Candidatus Neomarinimicrobiota bacterium]MBT4361636.1 glycoside hydrolase family 16 protein [Candidatus Neomarinimicrobiota bacterium]MBT4714000.1 glycoside hydrolase family 16 protein [Candidatus Neomarinimicrobiota bacterium]MBT4947044.1 glycoside hydrolase family 16 protein [Candidatus Neomarinimicrobiota bacterium]MBT5268458.1 glycoside hydrolase family 16 protein [Candidatus Neomarinimicrobiota bacterium]